VAFYCDLFESDGSRHVRNEGGGLFDTMRSLISVKLRDSDQPSHHAVDRNRAQEIRD
jgi:hypothetical protein